MNAEQALNNTSQVACITVTFNPDMVLLRTQLAALPANSPKVIVDNASATDLVQQFEFLAGTVPNARFIRNTRNLGLAAAINRGVRMASEMRPAPSFVLLLDQDSEPQLGSINALLTAFQKLECAGNRVGCVGPLLRDPGTGLTHGFHQCTRWRWKRVYPTPGSLTPVKCANLNGSGTLVPVELFMRLGGLDEALFIDHVDTEWAFRVLEAGYDLWGIPSAMFTHSMGEQSRRFWLFGWRVWPERSVQRHYFLFRNAIILMRRSYVPKVWKMWAVAKLVLTFWITLTIGPERCKQGRSMVQGARAGLTFRGSNYG